jgi:ribosomal protein S18 acetylase RimI-like enzyme
LKNVISILDWDSNFFGKKIGRAYGTINDERELQCMTELLKKQDLDLAYYSSDSPLADNLLSSESYVVKLVDIKTTYAKQIDKNLAVDVSVVSYRPGYPEPELIALAIESGAYSRFKVDEKIGAEKFVELYKTWIINSVNKKIAKEVLVYKLNETIGGLVTLGEKNLRADIGIIAVDVSCRGRGIGASLMRSAESWFAAHSDFEVIQVVTQGANTAACSLYEHCGYKVDRVEYVYHFWRK